jgi:hypothetical protein
MDKEEIKQIAYDYTTCKADAKKLEDRILSLFSVRKCDCSILVACEICGDEKGLDGDFWKNKNVL